MKKFRDIIILDDLGLVISTDSAASIGEKPYDEVKADVEMVAYYSAFVPIVEALCVRSTPYVMIDNLCNERLGYGERMMKGIRKAMDEAGMDRSGFMGSTEENFTTHMTALGVSLISKGYELRKAMKGDAIYAVGRALFGKALIDNRSEAMSINDYIYLAGENYIHDIVPVGSQGAMHELEELERHAGLKARIINDDFDYKESAGPSSICLFTMKEEDFSKLNIKKTTKLLGYME